MTLVASMKCVWTQMWVTFASVRMPFFAIRTPVVSNANNTLQCCVIRNSAL